MERESWSLNPTGPLLSRLGSVRWENTRLGRDLLVSLEFEGGTLLFFRDLTKTGDVCSKDDVRFPPLSHSPSFSGPYEITSMEVYSLLSPLPLFLGECVGRE